MGREMHAIKKGLLWQQRDRLFSRWKERYFVLTKDYLHCFKRAQDKISQMGQFIFKVKLVDVESVEWLNRRTYSAVALDMGREGRVLLRAQDGLEDWFELLEECTLKSKERRRALRSSHDPTWQRGEVCNNNSINSSMDEFLHARKKIAGMHHLSDSVPDLAQQTERGRREKKEFADEEEIEQWLRRRPANHQHRLSLLTDIDINSCDSQTETPPPSVPATFRGRPTSYRLNNDVFFMSSVKEQPERLRYTAGTATPSFSSSRSVLTPAGSLRSTHLFNPSIVAADRYSALGDPSQNSRFRDRSQSDAYRMEKPNWKTRAEAGRRTSYLVHATQV